MSTLAMTRLRRDVGIRAFARFTRSRGREMLTTAYRRGWAGVDLLLELLSPFSTLLIRVDPVNRGVGSCGRLGLARDDLAVLADEGIA